MAAEWFAKNHFAGSGQPWAFAAATLAGQGRREEAREYFQLALQRPWWTLEDLAGVLAGAGLEGSSDKFAIQVTSPSSLNKNLVAV